VCAGNCTHNRIPYLLLVLHHCNNLLNLHLPATSRAGSSLSNNAKRHNSGGVAPLPPNQRPCSTAVHAGNCTDSCKPHLLLVLHQHCRLTLQAVQQSNYARGSSAPVQDSRCPTGYSLQFLLLLSHDPQRASSFREARP
jgi:hypothetical protein